MTSFLSHSWLYSIFRKLNFSCMGTYPCFKFFKDNVYRLPNIQMDDWVANTNYTGEFENKPNHQVVQWFWEVSFERILVSTLIKPKVVRSFEHEQKAKLLQFVTGTAGVPAQGFGSLQGSMLLYIQYLRRIND